MRRFKRYSLKEFIDYLKIFVNQVKFSEIHVHATWSPTIASWRAAKDKESVIFGMWNFHTQTRCWKDIGQHATIDPEGYIWDGRSLLTPPASAFGHNDEDNDHIHPFMYEIIGNFDTGEEVLQGEQLKTVVGLNQALMELWRIPVERMKFHRDMQTGKTCPGSGITREWFIAQLKEDYMLKVEDADKIIDIFLGPAWKFCSSKQDKDEAHRLADELRLASGQKIK